MNQTDSSTNTSGCGEGSEVPPEIRGWSWGAFSLTWIWGIGNSTYIAFLMFLPVANIIMPFVLGAKGNEWAWQNKKWRDVGHFKATQRKWAWAGLIVLAIVIGYWISISLVNLKQSKAYNLSLVEIRKNETVRSVLGAPIEPGFLVVGSVNANNSGGEAEISYWLEGTQEEGKTYVYAIRKNGDWRLKKVIVVIPSQSKQISVVTDRAF